ncbi:MAG TPA: hypothetical protein VMG13_19045 [Trebonia sp.]|nr:hypothetical protein [Trebonia sp.]
MNDNEVSAARVVAVLLTDGWHRIVPGSFSVGPLSFGAGADVSVPGFRFADADAGRPYQPTTLAGPLASIIAVRQVTTAVRRVGERSNGTFGKFQDFSLTDRAGSPASFPGGAG